MTNARMWLVALGIFASGLAACQPGYIKASELERKEQGPSHCAARCEELHMRMGALVLVGDELPGCVCQPVEARPAPQAASASSRATPPRRAIQVELTSYLPVDPETSREPEKGC